MLAALAAVDFVVIFDETDAARTDRRSASRRAGQRRRLGPGRDRRPRRGGGGRRAGWSPYRSNPAIPRAEFCKKSRTTSTGNPAPGDPLMLFPAVTERLGHLAHHPAWTKRSKPLRQRLAMRGSGGTDRSAKALVAAHGGERIAHADPVVLVETSVARSDARAAAIFRSRA